MLDHWIADRMGRIEASGIRTIFELGRKLKDPINLSIGQPHFPVPEPIRQAAKDAIDRGDNGYTVTQGIPELRDRLRNDVAARLPGQDREVLVTSGTSGALMLALCATMNPGDEIILFDPYFVAYPHLVTLAGGTSVVLDTYPDFRIDANKVRAAITPKTKAILFSSPSNPTGACVNAETLRDLVALAREKGVLLIADEIYRSFWYGGPFRSAAEFDPNVLVLDGFGKSYGITGWRLGYAHGPKRLIEEMAKLQQFTFVCAPAPVQHGGVAALDFDVAPIVADFKRKRDFVYESLQKNFALKRPGGAFYVFPGVPRGTGTEFVQRAIEHNLLVIPGIAFGRRDTHIRVSYAATDEKLVKGMEILNCLANS
ncbi:MAG TPA: aminotransferase class I/II-fold pyridoxal phosphate-dependent enzyme [Gemmataceae bacterium]|jgi:aspartate aminotransferase/aminotransferase|nr:aminotransferase class I/II-fold pyridoxal phosphate-dependent enzyme [Gemmataceae bacterium]